MLRSPRVQSSAPGHLLIMSSKTGLEDHEGLGLPLTTPTIRMSGLEAELFLMNSVNFVWIHFHKFQKTGSFAWILS